MMFTKTQGQELIDNTTNIWTSLNGVNGRKFTNKTDTSKYIFLPAGGYFAYTNKSNAGSNCDYWSTAYYSSIWAYCIGATKDSLRMVYGAARDVGRLIRPVRPLTW